MGYKKRSSVVSGTRYAKTFEEAEVDICNSVLEYLGHDDFVVDYDAEVIITIGNQIIGYQVKYKAYANK